MHKTFVILLVEQYFIIKNPPGPIGHENSVVDLLAISDLEILDFSGGSSPICCTFWFGGSGVPPIGKTLADLELSAHLRWILFLSLLKSVEYS